MGCLNSTSQNQSFCIRDNTLDYQNYSNYQAILKYINHHCIIKVVTCIIITIGLLLILVAIRALQSMVRRGHVAPIYLINLLITDVLQLCYMIFWVAEPHHRFPTFFLYIYLIGLVASVGFMVCISLERYLVIVHPLWYRFRRTIKTSVGLCVLVWALSLVFVLYSYFVHDCLVPYRDLAILLLLPFPLFIFFLVGTIKALSASILVPSDEKRRIVCILVLLLLIYMLLFLPKIISFLGVNDGTLTILSFILLRLSPLADLVLYIFLRKGTTDKFLAFVCCCRMDSSEEKGEETGGEMEASSKDREETDTFIY